MATQEQPNNPQLVAASQEQVVQAIVNSIRGLSQAMPVRPEILLGALNAIRLEQEIVYQQIVLRSMAQAQQQQIAAQQQPPVAVGAAVGATVTEAPGTSPALQDVGTGTVQ
jgi:formate dehydrogenase maturation protein FdhE